LFALTVLPDGPVKDKEIGEAKTLEARLYKLNLPGETTKADEVVNHEVDAELQSLAIGGLQDFLAEVALRKAEIEAGNI